MRIYLAWKIKKFPNDWRKQLFLTEKNRAEEWFEYDLILWHYFWWPYFVSCDHWCMHWKHSHWRGANKWWLTCSQDLECRNVADKCRSWISQCDCVLAWINTTDCYGTIAEIWYAIWKWIPVFIAYEQWFEYVKDMYFLNDLVWWKIYITKDVKEAFTEVIWN